MPPSSLEQRVGQPALRIRLEKEARCEKDKILFGFWSVHYASAERFLNRVGGVAKKLGFWNRGLQNCLDYRIRDNTVYFADLPSAFDGYRILHLSDLHIDSISDGARSLKEQVRRVPADCCVVTGDFRYRILGDLEKPTRLTVDFFSGLNFRDGIFTVLGNHDSVRMVEGMEAGGLRVLLNESVSLTRDGQSLWLLGVDDPHYFHMDDLDKALSGVPKGGFKVLLAHSPEIVDSALRRGVHFYLCGHSHGGQICLPGGWPVAASLRCSRKYYLGAWTSGALQGYTSAGAGVSGIPLRYFSRPEIVIHTLRRLP